MAQISGPGTLLRPAAFFQALRAAPSGGPALGLAGIGVGPRGLFPAPWGPGAPPFWGAQLFLESPPWGWPLGIDF